VPKIDFRHSLDRTTVKLYAMEMQSSSAFTHYSNWHQSASHSASLSLHLMPMLTVIFTYLLLSLQSLNDAVTLLLFAAEDAACNRKK